MHTDPIWYDIHFLWLIIIANLFSIGDFSWCRCICYWNHIYWSLHPSNMQNFLYCPTNNSKPFTTITYDMIALLFMPISPYLYRLPSVTFKILVKKWQKVKGEERDLQTENISIRKFCLFLRLLILRESKVEIICKLIFITLSTANLVITEGTLMFPGIYNYFELTKVYNTLIWDYIPPLNYVTLRYVLKTSMDTSGTKNINNRVVLGNSLET